jgi:hypothetical protein
MRSRSAASLTRLALVVAMAFVSLLPVALMGQDAKPQANPGSYVPPRTSWGAPDLQGVWNNGTITPLERPSGAGEKEALSDEEVASADSEAASRADRRPSDPLADVALAYNAFWWDRGKSIGRTSLIVDPSDGHLPALTPEGQKRRDARAAARREHGPADTWEDRSYQERCLLYHGVPPMPTGYNNNYQIVQTPEYVAIVHEMIHEIRIIPVDGRPHLSGAIRQWMGDSRGRWEGSTLVVETTDYSGKIDSFRFPASSDTLRVVERFTRVGPNKIDYRFTVEDPTTYTKPWTAVLPMTKVQDQLYEYACHEGNYGMFGILSGERAQEAAAANARKGSR